MAMPLSGTFDYVARLTEQTESGNWTAKATVQAPVRETGDDFTENLVEHAEAIFAERSPAFEFREWPLELRVGNRSVIQFEGNGTIGPYDSLIVHPARDGDPVSSECAAIYLADAVPYAVVHASAILIGDGVEMTRY